MDRRNFLQLRHIASVIGQAVESTTPSDTALLRFAQQCMATTFEVVLPFGTPDAMKWSETAFDLLGRLEAQLTVYQEGSEISHLNRLAVSQSVPVEQGLFELLQLAATLTELTDGAFDVTAGALIKAWGFLRGPRRVPTEEERLVALEKVGMSHVTFDPKMRSVRFQQPGLEINLGSIGKGYALDQVAKRLNELPTFLIQGGYSSVFAKGSPSADSRGWLIEVQHPGKPGQLLVRVWLRDRALGTSASTFQHFEHEGRKFGHILDPRTGWPAAGVVSATVIAPTAAEADALSTAFFIGGPDLACKVCATRHDLGAILLPAQDDAEVVVLNLARDAYSPDTLVFPSISKPYHPH